MLKLYIKSSFLVVFFLFFVNFGAFYLQTAYFEVFQQFFRFNHRNSGSIMEESMEMYEAKELAEKLAEFTLKSVKDERVYQRIKAGGVVRRIFGTKSNILSFVFRIFIQKCLFYPNL